MFRPTAPEVRATRRLDPTPFGGVHRVDQLSMLVGGPRLDLDKDDRVAVKRDEVDFAEGTKEVPCDDAVTAPSQKPCG